ncbi:MAG: asparagine synthetase B family protein, partial [Clostridia bacterium]
MCGIAGEWITRPSIAGPPDLRGVVEALSWLRHRGPDGEGVFSAHRGSIAMTRLRVRGSDAAIPPYISEDGQIGAVMNGELYNYHELRDFVLARGHRLLTDADSEVLPHLYEELGPDMLPRLTGMFAIAVLDRRRNSLLLARDRLGLKPLYLWETPGRIRFASELKAFWAWPDFDPTFDESLVPRYLFHRFVPAPRTMFREVTKLPPGHRLMPQDSLHPLSESWWTLSERPLNLLPGSFEGASGELAERWLEVMRDHLPTDRRTGILLSGGVDSAWVAWGAARDLPGAPALTVSPGASQSVLDESKTAADLAVRLGLTPVEVPISTDL